MVTSRWVYRKLRNFGTGIEAGISCLKRAYGLARCTCRWLDHFKTYVWSSVVALPTISPSLPASDQPDDYRAAQCHAGKRSADRDWAPPK